jgi:hypothetical protein
VLPGVSSTCLSNATRRISLGDVCYLDQPIFSCPLYRYKGPCG